MAGMVIAKADGILGSMGAVLPDAVAEATNGSVRAARRNAKGQRIK